MKIGVFHIKIGYFYRKICQFHIYIKVKISKEGMSQKQKKKKKKMYNRCFKITIIICKITQFRCKNNQKHPFPM
jgi:hypothetical protein